jgi:ectoine hydroxylase-related dioxygenase (phytanoyl-CoA dioxygenase family)
MTTAADAGAGVELHPWNEEFTWEDSVREHRCLSDDQVARFDRDGFVVVPDAFDAATVAGLVDEIDRIEAGVESYLADQQDGRISIAEAGAITFSTHLVTQSERLAAFARHPFFAGVCADLVGPDVNLYWDQAVYKKPEKPRRFPWHQDNGYAFVEPQQYLTCWVALTDATLENGCLHVLPGSHREPIHEHVPDRRPGANYGYVEIVDHDMSASVPVLMDPGDLLLFDSHLMHRSTDNASTGKRGAMVFHYAATGTVDHTPRKSRINDFVTVR